MPTILGNVRFTIDMNIDIKSLPRGVNAKAFEALSSVLASYSADVWRSAVSGTMLPGMTRPVNDKKYAASIHVQQTGQYAYSVLSSYEGAEKIEEGFASYDMKPGLLASGKAKRTKDGMGVYLTIPFRAFTAEGASGSNRNVIPPDILKYVREHGVMDLFEYDDMGQRTKVPVIGYNGLPIGGVNQQATLRNAPAPMAAPYTWKSGQFAGLQKKQTPGGANRYMTFRRVSTMRAVTTPDGRIVWKGSDPNAWIHPGQEANPVSEAVQEYVQPYIELAIAAMFGTD